jgi:8-oxo-dGTP diphosphatase
MHLRVAHMKSPKSNADKIRPVRSQEEYAFLASYDASRFPHPSLAVDVALMTVDQAELRTVLVKRTEHPDLGKWSLPGGFVRMDESLDDAAARLLKSKAGLEGIFLEQLYTFGEPDRDPRIVSVAYSSLVDAKMLQSVETENIMLGTISVPWEGTKGGAVQVLGKQKTKLPIAFDHADILGTAVERLRGKLNYGPIGFELLPAKFTLRQLQSVHETILGKHLNKDSFRRRMLTSGMVTPTGQWEDNVEHRPAELYRFRKRKRGES